MKSHQSTTSGIAHRRAREAGFPVAAPRSVHLVAGNDRSILTTALNPHTNLVIWQREVPRAIVLWLSAVSPGELVRSRDIDKELPAECVPALISSSLPARNRVATAGIAMLAHDAGRLAWILAQISGNPVRLRLEWVKDRQCRHFHADTVPMRLWCTYRGPGTEWISSDVAATLRSSDTIPSLTLINRLGTGDVAIMRGSLTHAAAGPVRHRSPAADNKNDWRLLLAIDPASTPPRRTD